MTTSDALNVLREALPNGYTVEDYLDKGGQGSVYRGCLDGTPVALKVFSADHDPRRMQRETEVLQRLESPYVVRLLKVDTVNIGGADCPLVAYEYLSGGDLRQYLEPGSPPLTPHVIARIGMQVASGLECMWQERCVHRDVKPANIIRASEDRYVLVDVALAMHIDLTQITAPGVVAGTPGYLSPEQARGRRNLTIHSDVFSLGVTLYHSATKRHPFSGNQQLIGVSEPLPMTRHRSDVPRQLADLIQRMMAVRPAQRPRNLSAEFARIMEVDACST